MGLEPTCCKATVWKTAVSTISPPDNCVSNQRTVDIIKVRVLFFFTNQWLTDKTDLKTRRITSGVDYNRCRSTSSNPIALIANSIHRLRVSAKSIIAETFLFAFTSMAIVGKEMVCRYPLRGANPRI